jgi:hypothetical protein
VRFVKEHAIGLVLGIVVYELYWRRARLGGRGGQ